jgi:hypothetical protein
MPIVHVPVQLTMEQLLAAVKQLSPGELREFTEQFAAWQKQHPQQDEEEAALLACIAENSRLPAAEQRRFNRLRRKHQAETLAQPEATELQALWQRLERMHVARHTLSGRRPRPVAVRVLSEPASILLTAL